MRLDEAVLFTKKKCDGVFYCLNVIILHTASLALVAAMSPITFSFIWIDTGEGERVV